VSPPRDETGSAELLRGRDKSLIGLSAESSAPFRVPDTAFSEERVEKVVFVEKRHAQYGSKLASHRGLSATR